MIFLDFEASSLDKGSHPVEVAWCSHDLLSGWSCLIKPAPGWVEWSPASERIHGVTKARLEFEGHPADYVMRRLNEDLAAPERIQCISDNPEFDAVWLDLLEDGAGVKRDFGVDETPLDSLLVGAHTKFGVRQEEVHPLAAKRMADDIGLVQHQALADVIMHAFRMATIVFAVTVKDQGEEMAAMQRSIMLERANSLLMAHGRDRTR